jgi:ribosomal protein S1
VERHESFGVFVFLAPGKTGLVPFAETGLERDQDMPKAFPVGSDVEVMVLEVDPAGRRIRLSTKALVKQKEEAELREYAERSDSDPSSSFGSLADKLRGALGKG